MTQAQCYSKTAFTSDVNKVIRLPSGPSSEEYNSEDTEITSEDQSMACTNSCSESSTSSRKRKDASCPELDILSSFDAKVDMHDVSKNHISMKRRKVSMNRSLSRSSKSFMSTATLLEPTTHSKIESVVSKPDPSPSSHDSLLFQLHYVSSDAGTQGSRSSNSSAESIPFISHSQDLLGKHSNVSRSVSENVDKSFYGWFVELDDDQNENDNQELAFTAITAPKKNTHLDKEVDWACAADTVDDVLGDFF